MKKSIIVLLFISMVISLPGQSTHIDSLQKELAVSKEDTTRVLILQDLGDHYKFYSDSTLIYIDIGIQLSKELKYKAINVLDSALIFGLKADTLGPTDDFNIATIAEVYLKMHETAKAEKYLSRAINIQENTSSHTLNMLSEFYKQKNQVDSAIYFAKKAVFLTQNKKKEVTQLEIAATALNELYQKK